MINYVTVDLGAADYKADVLNTACLESRCALRLWYVDLVVSVEVPIEVCCCFTVFSCKTAREMHYR
jgi:hypothetical protein